MSLPQDKSLRAVLWCAVSSVEQATDEKASLREQERELRELANLEGWQIVDVLIVPGFSRRYYNFPEFAEAAAREGIEAGKLLLEHLDRRDFDVFACRDGSRFGREQSIFGEVVARVIDSGARLRTLVDGWIDLQNYRMYISMAGYAAAGAVDHLKRNQKASKDKLAARGLPSNKGHALSHRVIRNEYGRALKMIPDESKRRLFEDAALLLIEGVGYRNIEEELYRRFGHGVNGKPHKRYTIYHTLWNPHFWGHSARNHKNVNVSNGQKVGLWVFDPAEAVPEGVKMWRDTHEPMFTGDLAEHLKAELKRRSLIIKGNARPYRSHKFTGLIICGLCGCNMVYHSNHGHGGYQCHSKFWARNGRGCPRKWFISERKVQMWVNARLEEMLEQSTPDLLARPDDGNMPVNRVDTLRGEIIDIEEKIRRLILKQASAADVVSSIYDDQIQDFAEQLRILKTNLSQAEREAATIDIRALKRAYDELANYPNLEIFWQQPETVINQLLHRLMGRCRLVVKDSQVIGKAGTS